MVFGQLNTAQIPQAVCQLQHFKQHILRCRNVPGKIQDRPRLPDNCFASGNIRQVEHRTRLLLQLLILCIFLFRPVIRQNPQL